ncbi:MAG: hypothetical protein DMF53_26010 [Acidobacteria bacterium]|nr:MAG: hypothetical protein DMF53_26010 [Acidobacteriota bacterium]
MKPFTQSRLVLVLLAGLVAGLGMQGSAAAQREDHKGSATARGDAPGVTLMLAGTYRLRSDDADLQLQITSSGGTERSGILVATLSGKYQGRPMNQRGVLHVDNQGRQVLLTVTPQFPEGPESTAKSPHQLSATEIRAACAIYLSPSGEGWTGTTQDPGNCVKALALSQPVGQWQLRLLPNELRVMDATSKQELLLQKVSASGGAGR